jgi:hypothetical protein
MFNLALVYQLSANGLVAKLRKSLELYKLAFSFQHVEDLQDGVMFTMAILNTSGMIHKQLGNQEASQQRFEELLSCIMCVVEYSREATDTAIC